VKSVPILKRKKTVSRTAEPLNHQNSSVVSSNKSILHPIRESQHDMSQDYDSQLNSQHDASRVDALPALKNNGHGYYDYKKMFGRYNS
jgi:hypothetical protein